MSLILLGALNGLFKARQREADFQDKLEDLNRQKAALDTQYNQARESHELATQQSKDQVKEANEELSLLSRETLDNRDMALDRTSKAGSMQSEVNAMQLATLAVQGKQQTGDARQQAATSGFRGTGSALNLVENAKRSVESATAQARMQSKLSNYQTYASAVSNYTSATQQADAYVRKITQNNNQLERHLAELDLGMEHTTETYEQQGGFLAADIDYMNTKGRKAVDDAKVWDVVGGAFDGLMTGIQLFT